MSTSSVSSLTNNYLELLLNNAVQKSGASVTTDNLTADSPSSTSQTSDASQLSPFAQILSTLQQLQQSDPGEYSQVTKQIATSLQAAAQTDKAEGNSSRASQLTQLATDFTTVSSSGQLPNIQDLAQAIDNPPPPVAGSASSNAAASAVQQLEQLLATFQTGQSQSQSLSPVAIILQTLSNAGITSSASSTS